MCNQINCSSSSVIVTFLQPVNIMDTDTLCYNKMYDQMSNIRCTNPVMLRTVGRVLWRHLVDKYIERKNDKDEEETEEKKALGAGVTHSNLEHLQERKDG